MEIPRTLALLAGLTGCGDSGLAPSSLSLDLGVPDRGDGPLADAPPPPIDLAVPDLTEPPDSLPPDLTPGDSPPCRGGYLNSNDPSACPLRCGQAVEPVAHEGENHVNFDDPVVYRHNPPASGPHWPSPVPWRPYRQVVPREWWVHNL